MYQVRVALFQNIYCFIVLVDFSDLSQNHVTDLRSHGAKSGQRGGQGMLSNREIKWFGKHSSNNVIVSLAV